MRGIDVTCPSMGKQKWIPFDCERCGSSAQISERYLKARNKSGHPLLCPACRVQLANLRRASKTHNAANKAAKKLDQIELNGCVLTASSKQVRCRDYFVCSHEWSCLSAAASRLWNGWTAERGRQKT